MLALIYLYLLGLGMVGSGLIKFLHSIVANQPDGPSSHDLLVVGICIFGGLAIISFARLLHIACQTAVLPTQNARRR